ncbi:unnamed protein product [Clavelina lepadiformis]|uniref:Tetratricopeptide repeat protein 7 N-terminal domain-containing protein n=1 Tax=Clavelina lepadiformis TaxID=159417 RepID=A0ABP0FW28_CLALP
MSNKRQKLEAEVLRFRNQGLWEKAKDATKLLENKYGSSDPVVLLVQKEAELENYLTANEACPENIYNARESLQSVKKCLTDLQTSECKNSQFNVPEESSLLLAKVHYSQGNLKGSLDIYNKLNLGSMIKSISQLFKVRILSEAYAIKGLCLEEQALRNSGSESTEIIANYEQSVQLLIKYLADHEKLFNNSHGAASDDNLVSSVSETAIHRAIVLHIKNKNIWNAINLLRSVLRSLHTILCPQLLQTLSCKLAAILLRGISNTNYQHCDALERNSSNMSTSVFNACSKKSEYESGVDDSSFSSTLLPQTSSSSKPKFFLGENEFSPSNIEQEAILLILISEIMLNVDPVLDMSPDHADSREETLRNAENLHNLLCIAASSLGQYNLLSCCIEKSLKYAFNHHYLWHQYALSLYSAGKMNQAIPAFSECCRINPDDSTSALLAAKTCLECNPAKVEEGLKFAQNAVDILSKSSDADCQLSQAHLYVGVGMSLKALTVVSQKERVQCRREAIVSYSKSQSLDEFDHKPLLLMALEFAHDRNISQAMEKIKQALDLNPEDVDCLHLLTLLLTSRNQCQEAKVNVQRALQMHPGNIKLLATKCKLEQEMGEDNEALRTCDEIIKLWASKPEATNNTDNNRAVEGTIDRMTSDGLSVANQSLGAELDTGSVMAGSVAPSKYEEASSEITSSFADLQPRLSGFSSVYSQAWLQVAEVYLVQDLCDEAELCILEASQLQPLSTTVLYMRGLLHDHRGDSSEASAMYSNVLTIDPYHVKATERLANTLRNQGKTGIAKKLLQDATKTEIHSHTVWQLLAEILEEDGDVDGAIECSFFALNLESTAPVVSFSCISPRL